MILCIIGVLTCDHLDDDVKLPFFFFLKTVLKLIFFRALLLGLVCNHNLKEVSLDLSSCEVRNIYQDVFKICNDVALVFLSNPLGKIFFLCSQKRWER